MKFDRPIRMWAKTGRQIRLAGLRAARIWRTSLQARVVVSTLALGAATILFLGIYVTATIRDGLVDARLEVALAEAAASTRSMQSAMDSSTASTGTEVVVLTTSNLNAIEGIGTGRKGVALLRSPSSDTLLTVPDWYSDEALKSRISSELRAAISPDSGQQWQEISLHRDGEDIPAIAVGAPVTLPGAGDYELYLVFSLLPEAQTLAFVQQVLLGGSIILLLLLCGLAWLVTRQVVHPVQNASRVAAKLAAGRFDERLAERGEDEIARLAHSFNEMADSLQDKIERMAEMTQLQRRFVSDVAHELRTPLTTIRMAAEVIHQSRDRMSPTVARSTELLANQLDRFEELLAELLEISRFDAGAAILEAENSDLTALVDRVVEFASPLAEKKQIDVRIHRPNEAISADLDPRRIERIVRNLVINAIEHAQGQGVDITLGANATAVAVVVRDYGVGMTVDESLHVFDRFWRADPARARARTTGGTGLGLAISLEDTRLHGGWLEAWGRLDHGASFRLTLPRRGGMRITQSPVELVEDESPIQDLPPNSQSPSALPDLSLHAWNEEELT